MTIIRKLLFSISALMLAFMVLSLFLQVLARELRWAVDWTEETARFTFIAMVFIAATYATLTGAHLRVTVVANALARLVGQRAMAIFHLVVLLGFDLIMVWYSAVNFIDGLRYPNLSPALGFNQNYLFIAMTIGFALNAVLHVAELVGTVRRRE